MCLPVVWQWITRMLAISANLTLEGSSWFLKLPRTTSHIVREGEGEIACYLGQGASPMLFLLHLAAASRLKDNFRGWGRRCSRRPKAGSSRAKESESPVLWHLMVCVWGTRGAPCSPSSLTFRISLPLSPRIWKSPSRISGR